MHTANRAPSDLTRRMEQGSILPLVIRLTLPAVAAQLITFLYNIVDRMYVARIPDAGMDALAALGIVLPITLMIQAFANLIGLGSAPRAGIKLGEGDPAEANRIFNTAFLLLLLIGLILGAGTFCFSRQIVELFGCPASAVAYADDYLKIYACGTVFVMLAQGLNPFEASAAAVYLHGLAGDLARKKLGETGMTPTDMLQLIPQAFYQCRGV